MNSLAGKYVLITGASRGLGRQLAIDFARAGAAGLALVGRTPETLAEVSERVREAGPQTKVVTIAADLAREDHL